MITTYASVAEAVSFAIPSEIYGQEVGVAVVAKEGKNITAKDIMDYVASKTAKFKVPKRVSDLLKTSWLSGTMLI